MRSFDVIVVGGGPAGAASALKCSQLGLTTLLAEKGTSTRHKPCGGVLPNICVDILDDLGLKIPVEVMCSPPTIGLFYVPPSGRSKGGSMRNYRLLNVNRDRFDEWFRKSAGASGTTVLHEAQFVRFEGNGDIKVLLQVDKNITEFSTRYLIGADGAFSTVKRQLNLRVGTDYLMILQELWSACGDFGEYFYAFLNWDITPAYSYVIPKNGKLVVGTGVPRMDHARASDCIGRFKEWLRREFAFSPVGLQRRETAVISYSSPTCGDGNTILVGDAAGFCNHLSGEGIRLAIESGIAAAESVEQAERCGETLCQLYAQQVQPIAEFVRRTHEFAIGMTDHRREEFVRLELARISLDAH